MGRDLTPHPYPCIRPWTRLTRELTPLRYMSHKYYKRKTIEHLFTRHSVYLPFIDVPVSTVSVELSPAIKQSTSNRRCSPMSPPYRSTRGGGREVARDCFQRFNELDP
jgi:hypothetical protein